MSTSPLRPSPDDRLRAAALEQFAEVGFAGASLQQIADDAGYAKSSVLYHFASKEALLEAVLSPAIEELERILTVWSVDPDTDDARRALIVDYVDMLLAHRLEVYTFMNHGHSLAAMPVIARANRVVTGIADAMCDPHETTEAQLRFGVALGGTAYTLAAFGGAAPEDEVRAALIRIISELLAPLPTRATDRPLEQPLD